MKGSKRNHLHGLEKLLDRKGTEGNKKLERERERER